MRTARYLLAVAAPTSTMAVTADAAGWPNWCPLGCNHDGSSQITNVSDTGGTPTMMARMNAGTKRFVQKTKSLLTFDKTANQGTAYVRPTKHKEPGFFYKMFHPAPPPPPETVKEWMSLEQVQF